MYAFRTFAMTAAALVALPLAVTAHAQEAITLRFLTSDNDPGQVAAYTAAVNEYKTLHPEITIELEPYAVAARLKKLQAEINARTAPDIIKINPEERLVWAREGFLEPMEDVYQALGPDDFVDGSIVKVDGTIYDIPYVINHFSTLWYREDLLKAKGVNPPTNWDELKAAAAALTEKNAAGDVVRYGIVFPASNLRQTSIQLAQMVWSAGGTFFDKDLKVTVDTQPVIDALTLVKDLAQYAPPAMASYSTNEVADAFALDKVAMAISSGALPVRVLANAPALFPVTYGARYPAGPAGSFFFAGTNNIAIPSAKIGGKHPKEAKEFLVWFLNSKHFRDYLLVRGGQDIPAFKSRLNDPTLPADLSMFKDRPQVKDFYWDLSNTLDLLGEVGADFSGGKVTLSGVQNPYMAAVIARNIPATMVQKVLVENLSPADAAKWGQEEIERLVQELQ